jgi:CheY-like chemotaxis protein
MAAAPVPIRAPIVLVVDDEEGVRLLIRRTLEAAGYRVCEADDGFEALSVLLQGRAVDLVLTDVRMPRMDGCELAAHMAALALKIPILFVTGYVNEPESGALPGPVLAKPFGPEQLVAFVRDASRQTFSCQPPADSRQPSNN